MTSNSTAGFLADPAYYCGYNPGSPECATCLILKDCPKKGKGGRRAAPPQQKVTKTFKLAFIRRA